MLFYMRLLNIAVILLVSVFALEASIVLPEAGVVRGAYSGGVSAFTHKLFIGDTELFDTATDPVGATFEVPVGAGPLDLRLWVRNTRITYVLPDWHFYLFNLGNYEWAVYAEDLPMAQTSPPSFLEGFEADHNDVWFWLRWTLLEPGQPVPEPSGLALFIIGGLLLGLRALPWGK